MGQIAKRVEDKRLLKLIRAFLNAGVMENGMVGPSVEGAPQRGPLSLLLSNLVLDELDRELEHRGHRFVRYADDCNIYVRNEGSSRLLDTCLLRPDLESLARATRYSPALILCRREVGFEICAGAILKIAVPLRPNSFSSCPESDVIDVRNHRRAKEHYRLGSDQNLGSLSQWL